MTISQTKLAELYVSFFNRAPDSSGLTYWVDQLDNGPLTVEEISKNWISEQAEGLAKYPSTLTDADFIAQIYQDTLGRGPDVDGLAYWQDQLANNSVDRGVFLAALINGAKANSSPQGVLDAATLNNKAAAGVAFADRGLNDLTLATKVVASVNSNPDTLTAVQAVIKLAPNTDADLTPGLINLLSKTFDSIINLNAKAPGEVGDLASYLTAVANQTTGTTDLSVLLTNITTTVTNAATNSAALDNPETLANEAVIAATPSTGGDVPTPPAFTIDGNGKLDLNVANKNYVLTSTDKTVTDAHFTLNNSNVSLPNDKATNVLVHAAGADDTTYKNLTIKVTGENELDLGNGIGLAPIGYALANVTVEGKGDLDLGTLYFGSPATQFSSVDLIGDVHLDALVYTGSGTPAENRYKWSIEFGSGNDTLKLHNSDGTGNYPWAGAASIDGGGGHNTLELNDFTYKNWHDAETKSLGANTVSNFQTLEITDASEDTTYVASLLGNDFTTLRLNGAGKIEGLTNDQVAEFRDVDSGGHASATFTGTTAHMNLVDVASGDTPAGVGADSGVGTEFRIGGDDVTTISVSGSVKAFDEDTDGVLSLRLTEGTEKVDRLDLALTSNTYIDFNDQAAGNIVTSDASKSTGDLTTILGGIDLKLETSIGGSGNDNTTIYADFLTSPTLTLDGGAGNDTLSLIYGSGGTPVAVTVKLGDGNDTFALTNGNIQAGFTSENIVESLITIQDFASGDTLSIRGFDGFTEQTAVDAVVNARSTIYDAVSSVAALLGSDVVGHTNFAKFTLDGNTYVYGDLADAGLTTGDVLIQLTGQDTLSSVNVHDLPA
ncbi:MAG: DUF4214 domain-containing protein [Pseudomonas sp.]|uniref:DUF4214 domain-containing protein n=1 Tax=Pseudomonas sp. TaxID=306 RepID=UPI003D6E8158